MNRALINMNARLPFLAAVLLTAILHAAEPAIPALPDGPRPELAEGLYAEFTTPHGVFITELFYQRVPMTCASFVGLAEGTIVPREGKPFYTGLKWYRVVPGFVIQSGDPTFAPDKKEEDPDPGHPYSYPDEFVPGLRHGEAGMLSMANAGPDTNSSEFFVTLADTTRLNYLHSVFGRTVHGLEVLSKVQQGDAFSIKILRLGADAKSFKADEAAFKARAEKAAKYSGAAEPGPAAHFDDPDKVLPTDVPRAKNFNYKLTNFQRATGQRIFARVHARSPETPEGAPVAPGRFARQLARELGLEHDGVLAVYLADNDEWSLWIPDRLLPRFNPDGRTLQDRKSEFVNAVLNQAAVYTEQARKLRGPGRPLTPADLAKYSVDAMLDALIFAFDPVPSPALPPAAP